MMSIDHKATGDNLRMLIKAKGLSVKYVQYTLGFNTPQSVYKWIHGKTLPTLDNLIVLADILDCKIDDIIVTTKD